MSGRPQDLSVTRAIAAAIAAFDAEARGAAEERARLRERVKERRQTLDMRPPLTKDGYLLALDDVMAMLAEPGEERS